MLILDTDHLTALSAGGSQSSKLLSRGEQSGEVIGTTIVSVEEQLRGWLARVARAKHPAEQVRLYGKLQASVEFLGRGLILPYDTAASEQFQRLAALRLRIGTMDLKMAAIVMSRDATLLSRNLRDFERVSGLRVEDWLS